MLFTMYSKYLHNNIIPILLLRVTELRYTQVTESRYTDKFFLIKQSHYVPI